MLCVRVEQISENQCAIVVAHEIDVNVVFLYLAEHGLDAYSGAHPYARMRIDAFITRCCGDGRLELAPGEEPREVASMRPSKDRRRGVQMILSDAALIVAIRAREIYAAAGTAVRDRHLGSEAIICAHHVTDLPELVETEGARQAVVEKRYKEALRSLPAALELITPKL